jgi:probable F420-dependent oxidoreductase
VWAGSLRTLPIAAAKDAAAELEALSYGVMWFPEADARDVFVNLTLLLGATTTIAGGTAVANIWARDAMAMSSAAKTLTEAFPDRFVLGLGVSHQPLVEGMRGHTYARPLAAMRSYLDAMDTASYSGHDPGAPVRRMIAALGPSMLQLAAQRSDGVIPYLTTPEHTAIARAALPDGAVCPVQAIVLDDDPTRVREIARQSHTSYYMNLPNYTNNLRRLGFDDDDFASGGSDRLIDALVASGPLDAIVARIRDHFDAGADHVCAQLITENPTRFPIDELRTLAPALRGFVPQPAA